MQTETYRSRPSSGTSATTPVRPVLFMAFAGAAAYWFLIGSAPSDRASTAQEEPFVPQPQPTSSSRSENEQRARGAYFEAIRKSPGFSASDKSLAETNKLMRAGGTSSDR